MKGIRKILMFLFLGMAALMAIGLALPSGWSAERSVQIDAEPDAVFAQVVDLQKWRGWAVWFEHDPTMQTTFSDPSTGPGAFYTWSGNPSVGQGRLELKDIEPGTSVALVLEMDEGRFHAEGTLELEPAFAGTRVSWRLGGELGADPFARLNRTLLQDAVGGSLQANLDKLKSLVEQQR